MDFDVAVRNADVLKRIVDQKYHIGTARMAEIKKFGVVVVVRRPPLSALAIFGRGWTRRWKQTCRLMVRRGRDSEAAIIFMDDLAKRLANRVQLTCDGHKAYLEAVEGAFGADIDYAMLVKVYGPAPEGQRHYSPAECIGAVKPSKATPILNM